jgi:hypothetical protein
MEGERTLPYGDPPWWKYQWVMTMTNTEIYRSTIFLNPQYRKWVNVYECDDTDGTGMKHNHTQCAK